MVSTGITSTDVDAVDITHYNVTGAGAVYFDVDSNDGTDLVIISRIDRDTPNSVTQLTLGKIVLGNHILSILCK